MIRNDSEYKQAIDRLDEETKRLRKHKSELRKTGLSATEIKRVTDPLESFHAQLVEEVEYYEQLKKGKFKPIKNLNGLGHLLIALRIAQGITQRELARRTNVHESQVSRDERNEYFGITLERASAILDALNATTKTTAKIEKPTKPNAA